MNSLSTLLERLVDDPRVRIAGPAFAFAVTIGFLILGNVAGNSSGYSKTVSVLPEQPLNIPIMRLSQPTNGTEAILAWKNAPAPVKPGTVTVQAAGAKVVKGKKGTLTARR